MYDIPFMTVVERDLLSPFHFAYFLVFAQGMPRRSNNRAPHITDSITDSPPPPHHDHHPDNLALLRRQWRWAAFSQFFYTFSPLFAMNDVGVVVSLPESPPCFGTYVFIGH